jgi:hypothetical protein
MDKWLEKMDKALYGQRTGKLSALAFICLLGSDIFHWHAILVGIVFRGHFACSEAGQPIYFVKFFPNLLRGRLRKCCYSYSIEIQLHFTTIFFFTFSSYSVECGDSYRLTGPFLGEGWPRPRCPLAGGPFVNNQSANSKKTTKMGAAGGTRRGNGTETSERGQKIEKSGAMGKLLELGRRSKQATDTDCILCQPQNHLLPSFAFAPCECGWSRAFGLLCTRK